MRISRFGKAPNRSLPRARGMGMLLLSGIMAAAAGGFGCGSQFELPPQPEPGRIPEPGTYNLLTTWSIAAPTSIAISGLYTFVIEDHSRLGVYYSNRYEPVTPSVVGEFEELVEPVQVAISKKDSLFVIVADRGDMQCKVYYWLGGEPLSRFTDSRWNEFSGLAADQDLKVYVSDATRDTISCYDRWGAHIRVVSEYGTGSGYVIAPNGIGMASGVGDSPLLVADTGKNWVQRLRADTTGVATYLDPIGFEQGELDSVLGVAADRYGEFAFVADTGHDRVLKYLMSGAFVDTVYSAEKIELELPLRAPRYLCAEDSLVFLSDPPNDRVLLLLLASQ